MQVKIKMESSQRSKWALSPKRRNIIQAGFWISPIISTVALPTHAQTSTVNDKSDSSDTPDTDPPAPPPVIPQVGMHIVAGKTVADYTDPTAITSAVDNFTGVDLGDLDGELLIVKYSLMRQSSPTTEELIAERLILLTNGPTSTPIVAKSVVSGLELEAVNALPGDTAKIEASMDPTSIFEGSGSITTILKPAN